MPLHLTRRAGSPYFWITGTIGGVRLRESTGTSNERLAREALAVREAEAFRVAFHGEKPPQRRVTFATAVISYLETEARSPSTKARVARLLKHFGQGAMCDVIDQERLDQACRELLRPGAKPTTRLREVLTPARAVLSHAARRGWCAPPIIERTAVSPARTGWMTPAEADRLIAGAAKHLRPLLTFLVGTGARLSEALDLTWQEVDLTHARATLRATKNGRDRIVDLCPRVVAALAGIDGRAGSVFRTNAGKAYAVKRAQGGGQIKTAWARALAQAGLSGLSPHSLRHTWATWHYAVHRDLLALRTDGGWQTASQVERYAKLAPVTMAAEMAQWRGDKRPAGTNLTQRLVRAS